MLKSFDSQDDVNWNSGDSSFFVRNLDSSAGHSSAPSTSYHYPNDPSVVGQSSESFNAFAENHSGEVIPQESVASGYFSSAQVPSDSATDSAAVTSSSFPSLVNFTSSSESTYTAPFPGVDYRPLHWGDSNHHQSFQDTQVKQEERLESNGDPRVSIGSSGRISSSSDVSLLCFLLSISRFKCFVPCFLVILSMLILLELKLLNCPFSFCGTLCPLFLIFTEGLTAQSLLISFRVTFLRFSRTTN